MFFSSWLLLAAALLAQHPPVRRARRRAFRPRRSRVSKAAHLTNIRQVTTGLARAGEGYFSPDGRSIIFQAVPHVPPSIFHRPAARRGWIPDLPGAAQGRRAAKMVSTGKGRCTCPYFHPGGESILFASTHLSPSTEAEPSKGPAYSRTARYRWEFPESMDIFTADLDGKNLKRLTDTPGYDAEASYSARTARRSSSRRFATATARSTSWTRRQEPAADHECQGLRRRPVLLARRQADHLPQRPQGKRPASSLRQQHRGHGRACPDPE